MYRSNNRQLSIVLQEAIHASHVNHIPDQCYCCHRFVDKSSRKTVIYSDGRIVCKDCHSKAVNTQPCGRNARESVVKMFDQAGLKLPVNKIQLFINDKEYAKKSLGRGDEFHGLTITTTEYKWLSRRKTYKVFILSGLHEVAFKGILAHEFMHVFIAENNIKLNLQDEEGLCELVNYFTLEVSHTRIGNILMEMIRNNPDPTYGGGFRKMKFKLDQMGSWYALIQSLKS
ncbi:MAG: protein DA1 [Saprospiraceae bacterium]|nr:protein DA1 [Saprospiraceae bacterium]